MEDARQSLQDIVDAVNGIEQESPEASELTRDMAALAVQDSAGDMGASGSVDGIVTEEPVPDIQMTEELDAGIIVDPEYILDDEKLQLLADGFNAVYGENVTVASLREFIDSSGDRQAMMMQIIATIETNANITREILDIHQSLVSLDGSLHGVPDADANGNVEDETD